MLSWMCRCIALMPIGTYIYYCEPSSWSLVETSVEKEVLMKDWELPWDTSDPLFYAWM